MAGFSKPSGVKMTCMMTGAVCLSAYSLMHRLSTSKLNQCPVSDLNRFPSNQRLHSMQRSTKDFNLNTFSKILKICQIAIPTTDSKEFALVILSLLSFVARTYVDLWMIHNNTAIESAIVSRSSLNFTMYLSNFVASIPLVSALNASMKCTLELLKGMLFERLTYKFQSLILRDNRLYHITHSASKENIDIGQIMVNDTFAFASTLVDLAANITKPSMTILVCFIKLARATAGPMTPMYMIAYLIISGLFVTRLRHPLLRLNKEEHRRMDGIFNMTNKLLNNSEQIAFYGGEQRELFSLRSLTNSYIKQYQSASIFRLGMDIVDQAFAKYLATVVGFSLAAMNFLHPSNVYQKLDVETAHAMRLKSYYENGRILIKMASSVGRLVMCSRDLTRLITHTNRITDVYDSITSISRHRNNYTGIRKPHHALKSEQRVEIRDKFISFEDVPIVAPDGTTLIESLTFQVPQGLNVLIKGPNGCGKSSIFRTLGELWELQRGKIVKPPRQRIFYIPQTPYMPDGSLRDQIIYPDSSECAQIARNTNDSHLLGLLEKVDLIYLLERGGWNFICDWSNELSGGEKQRLAMARLLYHKPQFAILDECTSAVSVDIEGSIYTQCKTENITLLTVSHRQTLLQYHDYCLTINSNGTYSYLPINTKPNDDLR